MALTQNHLKNVCCIWQGSDECRYLESEKDSSGNMVYVCCKKSSQKKIIDEEVKDFISECRKKKIDPSTTGNALGNNCSGYLKLPNKQQGYDLP